MPRGLVPSSNRAGALGSLGHMVMIRSGNNKDRELNIDLSRPTKAILSNNQ